MRLVPRRDHPLRRRLRGWGRTVIERLGLHGRLTKPRFPLARWDGRNADGTSRPHIVFVSGEPGTPGHAYRVERPAQTAAELGWTVDIVPVLDLEPDWWRHRAPHPEVVVIWRARHSTLLERAVTAWRQQGARILCDLDDHMVDPAIARPEIIDAIRSLGLSAPRVAEHYASIRRTLDLADACIVPTAPLAAVVAACGIRGLVLPNGFDRETYRASREAVLRRAADAAESDGLVRIGYAAGSRTHQRDFAAVAPALARVLHAHPECRLVLFREARRRMPLVDIGECPALAGFDDRIEWRPFVPLERLPDELARFDINLAPVEVGNVFCEAKSELKYFEAALVGVPTIAAPTEPYRTAITSGRTGFLAADTAAWHDCLERLVIDADLRKRIGQAAFHDVLHRYGPDARSARLAEILAEVRGVQPDRRSPPPASWFPAESHFEIRQARASGRQAALAQVLGDLLPGAPAATAPVDGPPRPTGPRLPDVPHTRIVRRQAGMRLAQVAVVVPLFNYADLVSQTLASVAGQSLDSLELVVVDDCSTDESLAVADAWLARHGGRFVATTLVQTVGNQGLPLARNAGFATAEAPFVFPLDADNTLEPRCLWLLLEKLLTSPAAAAHPTLQHFGTSFKCKPAEPWSPERLRRGNYIDAMALVRKSAWAAVGGYVKGDFSGWEDYDLWCRFVEHGFWSEAVPEAVAGYRVHRESMLKSTTEPAMERVVAAIRREHPWLTVRGA